MPIPCAPKGCDPIPSLTPVTGIPGYNHGYTWSHTFPVSNDRAAVISTVNSTVEDAIFKTTEVKDIADVSCKCEEADAVNPVYARAILKVGSGVGLNRSKIILCRASEENLGNLTDGECPIRDMSYIVHINRVTEKYTINRSNHVKSKN